MHHPMKMVSPIIYSATFVSKIQNPQLPTTPQLQRLIARLAMVIEQDIPPPPQYPPPPPPTGVEPATGPLEAQFD